MAELTEQKQHPAEDLFETDILSKIAQIASSKLELREVLDIMVHVVADKLNKDACSICLLKPEQKIICIETSAYFK
jgi:signal transduction protein with GAF and PtsI domain